MSNILEDLNAEQRSAILHDNGPLLILAGAGSGKTKVITHKFAHIASKNPPDSILAVTFTNKAANEMKERIAGLMKKNLNRAWVGTFHSQCSRLLRKEIKPLGYGHDFSIMDDSDQSNLIRHILKEFNMHEALHKGVASKISFLKSSMVSPEEFLSNGDRFGFEDRLSRIYFRYQDELKRCNALDFDDLIGLTIKLFEEHPKTLKKFQSRFHHILVDEFQDTNYAQYALLKLLAASKNTNICAVGDDDQSIYAFRGAEIKNIMSFEKDFKGTTVIRLEQNYRSTKNILDVASVLISKNPLRKAKTLWTNRKQGEKISQCWFPTAEEEAKYIAKAIKELYLKGIYDYSDFSILFRVNLQARGLEDALRDEGIAYRVLGAMSFYQRKEIKDLASYIKLAVNSDNNVSLRRVINVPPRGIGASTLAKIEQFAKKKSISLFAAARELVTTNSITASTKEKLNSFLSIVQQLDPEKFKTAADMLRYAYDGTGYGDTIDEDRQSNIKEFIASAENMDVRVFIDRISLVSNSDDKPTGSAVSLLTLHSAKGLEFPVAFIAGIEEGVLPYFKADSPQALAEERRLLYVGMTRAKDMLWLTGASKRRLYSKVQEQQPSRFLRDIPSECCLKIDKIDAPPSPMRRGKSFIKPAPARAKTFVYSIGTRVRHPNWGVGVVRDCYGEGEDQKITVNFPNVGVKRLALKFASLERI